MINVLLPAMGTSTFYKDSYFPKPLYEINGKTMLEMVVDNYAKLEPKQYIFVFSEEDCLRFHLDSSVKILTPASRVIKLGNQTAGALCTCLMAIEYINDDVPLIVANSDQVIETDYCKVIEHFEKQGCDAGLITFPNIHPRWSYARKMGNEIVEVAEKRPLSKNAIAGFYYYKKGSDFVKAAKKALLKQNNLDDRYYISSSINELILMGKKVGFYDISKEQYKSFYSPAKVKEYEESMK
ncbi:MAG: glycosyltransferase family 2 protein [Eubacteriales bacterium]|nr:glycosyltransferase family 2 protein [Eubacteriales bacterium]